MFIIKEYNARAVDVKPSERHSMFYEIWECQESSTAAAGFQEAEMGEVNFPEISTPILEKVCEYCYYKLRYANECVYICILSIHSFPVLMAIVKSISMFALIKVASMKLGWKKATVLVADLVVIHPHDAHSLRILLNSTIQQSFKTNSHDYSDKV